MARRKERSGICFILIINVLPEMSIFRSHSIITNFSAVNVKMKSQRLNILSQHPKHQSPTLAPESHTQWEPRLHQDLKKVTSQLFFFR